MKYLSDEQIFDILDGFAEVEIQQKHRDLLQNSIEYRQYFDEIQALHLQLSDLTIEQPSAEFTKNVIGQVAFKKANNWSLKWILGLGISMIGLIIMIIAFSFNTTLPSEYQFITNLFLNQYFLNIILLVNGISLLLLFDKKILKPYFERRVVGLH